MTTPDDHGPDDAADPGATHAGQQAPYPGPGYPQQGYPQQGYPQQGWPSGQPGQPQQPPYGYAPPPAPGYYNYGHHFPPPHRDANTTLVLGIVALAGGLMLALPLIAGPFAWVIGRRTIREIDASHGQLGGRDSANAGMIMGIIATVLLVLGVVAIAGLLVLLVAVGGYTSVSF